MGLGGGREKGDVIQLFSCYLLKIVCSEHLHVLVGAGTDLGGGEKG